MNNTNEESEAPEILEASWNPDQVVTLFEELKIGATVKHVQVRTESNSRSLDCESTLEDAQRQFQEGVVKAIQIKYEFDGQLWCDTMMIDGIVTRIIRSRNRF